MKKVICLIISVALILTMFCSCGKRIDIPSSTTKETSYPVQTKNNLSQETPVPIQTESNVSQEHINFILNREVFMSGMDAYYNNMVNDYNKYFDDSLTFGHLINEKYFDNIKWEYFSNEDDMIIVAFYGTTTEAYKSIPVSASFAWTSNAKAPIINQYIFGKDDNGNYIEHSANEAEEKYGIDDYSMALFQCDATFSMMLAIALVDLSNNNTQEQATPTQNTIEITTPQISSGSNNPQFTEKPTERPTEKPTEKPTERPTEKPTPTMTAEDYYELGKDCHSSKQYLKAVEYFQKAGNYSDANTMILDCYYQYGKDQMDLQYTSEAIKYLSMCRGYKDTDEILLSFYYSQATVAYNALIKDFSNYGDHSSLYQDAKQKLLLCEGYKDSSTMMRVVESVYTACKKMDSVSNYEASLYGMTVSANGNNVSITKDAFMGTGGGDMILSANVAQKTFSATISHIFAPNMRNYGEVKVIEALILLFTDVNNVSDLSAKLQNENNWTINGTTENFSSTYGGYNISIQVTEADWGYVDCTIKVNK